MANVQYETEINAPVEKVFEYYTNPDNIKEAWPRDIVKESESLSGSKSEEGSEMKVKGQYMGKEEEMILEFTKIESSDRYGWWLNELDSLGIVPKKTNELNDKQEIRDLSENIKQTLYQDYKTAYNE
jgi:hypothetical protein